MTDTGVVDPIRVPAWLRTAAERAWATIPSLARVFIGLALADILARWIGFLQPSQASSWDLGGLYAFFIPHDLWVLLPAVLLVRRPDAMGATPLIVLGAALGSVSTIVGRPLEYLASGQDFTLLNGAETTVGLALAASLLLLARGLRRLNPPTPSAPVAGLSNIVLGVSLVGTGVELVVSLVHLSDDIVGTATTGAELASILGSTASSLAWSYFLWMVIRGLGDVRRPRVALIAAAVGATLFGILTGVTAVIGDVVVAAQPPSEFWAGSDFQDAMNALGFIATGVGEALVLIAFGLGLAEPPVPYVRPPAPRSEATATATAEPSTLPL